MSPLAISWICAIATGGIAIHGLTYRDARGERPIVHLVFGAIALLFFFRFLFLDILGAW